MSDELGFIDAAVQTQRAIGKAPLIGTFAPKLGDIARDPENNLWAWDGARWIDHAGRPAKTFEQWMDLS